MKCVPVLLASMLNISPGGHYPVAFCVIYARMLRLPALGCLYVGLDDSAAWGPQSLQRSNLGESHAH